MSSRPVVQLLGDPELVGPFNRVAITRGNDRRILASLALSAPGSSSFPELESGVWGEDPPHSARRSIQNSVHRLRRSFIEVGVDDAILTMVDGYALSSEVSSDLAQVQHVLARADDLVVAGDNLAAVAMYSAALGLWRADPFWDTEPEAHWVAVSERWREQREGIITDLIVALLRSTKPGSAQSDAEVNIEAHLSQVATRSVDNERLCCMRALLHLHSGEPRQAMSVLEETIHRLETRGLEPSPEMATLVQSVRDATPSDALVLLDRMGRRAQPADLPFVGRTRELQLLAEAKARSATQAQLVTVVGSAGIGKTELVRRYTDSLGPGSILLSGRCRSGSAVAFEPVAEALRAVFSSEYSDLLQANVALHGGELTRLIPARHWPIEAVPALPALDDPSSDRLYDSVATLLEMLAARSGVVLAVDDGQWMGPSSRALLDRLLTRRSPAGLLVIVTARPPLRPLATGAETETSMIELGPLDRADLRRLIEGYVESTEVADRLARISGGRPLLARQILHDVRVSGATPGNLGHDPVRTLVGRRLLELTLSERSVVDVISLVESADEELLSDVLVDATPPDLPTVLGHLAADGLIEGGPGWSAGHDLVRSAIADGIPLIRRAYLQHRIGQSLAGRTDSPAAEIAHHLAEAAAEGLGAKDALRWVLRAASEAGDSLALSEAEDWYRRGLELVELVPEDSLRAARSQLLVELGVLLTGSGRASESDRLLSSLWQESRGGADPELAAQIALALSGDTWHGRDRFDGTPGALVREALEALPASAHELRSRLYLRLGFMASAKGDTGLVNRLVTSGLREAEQTRDTRIGGAALGAVLALDPPHRDLSAHQARARKIVESARLVGDDRLLVTGLIHEATDLLMEGQDPGLERFGRLVNLLVRRYAEPFARPAVSLLSFLRGDLQAAERSIRAQLGDLEGTASSTDLRMGLVAQLLSVLRLRGRVVDAADVDSPPLRGDAAAQLGRLGMARALADLGQKEPAHEIVGGLVEDVDVLLSVVPAGALYVLGELSELVVGLGRDDLVDRVERELSPFVELSTSSWIHLYGGSARFHLGRLALLGGRLAEARTLLDAALLSHENLRVIPFIARSHLVLAELALAAERPTMTGRFSPGMIHHRDAALALARSSGMDAVAAQAARLTR